MPDIYGFRQGPTYQSMTQADFWQSAMDQPLSLASTLGVAAESGALETSGLGTAIRDIGTPEGVEPEPTGSAYTDAVRGINDVISPRTVAKRIVGTFDRSQPAMTEDAWKSSANYREGIPFDPAMTEQRAASLAYQFDQKKVRDFYTAKRPITSFIGQFAGQAVDPINFIPILGPAVREAAAARFGLRVGETLVGAGEAVANTGIFGVATAGTRAKFGDDVSWQAMLSDMAMAGLIGGAAPHVFRAIGATTGKAFDAFRDRFTDRASTIENIQAGRLALNEAIDGMVHEGEVRLGPNSIEPIERVAAEMDGLSRAYDTVRQNPTGDVHDPLVQITPEDIEGTIVARGAFKNINEAEFSKRGWGLVKMIWRHGEESREPPDFQIQKEDITDLPNVVRDFEPSSISADGRQREWRVGRNGRTIVYADTEFDGRRHTVTAYVQKPDAPGAGLPLSGKRTPAAAGSPDEPLKPVGDTALQSLPSTEGGQPLAPASRNIARQMSIDNSAPAPEAVTGERKSAEARIAKPEDAKALAEQYRVNAQTGEFPEMAAIENLKAQGRLTEDDARLLDEAQEDFDNASAYGEALKSVVNCLL